MEMDIIKSKIMIDEVMIKRIVEQSGIFEAIREKTGDWSRIEGIHNNVWGNSTNIYGDVSNIFGYVGNIDGMIFISGNVSNISGSIKGDIRGGNYFNPLRGDVSNITGDVTDIFGDMTGIEATADEIREVLREYYKELQE